MDFRSTIRDVRRTDKRPAMNDHGSIKISRIAASPPQAAELISCQPVLFVDVSTIGALSRRVPRINQLIGNSFPLQLVEDKLQQLITVPRMQDGSLALPNCDPVTDALQVFERYAASCAFSGSNDLLADNVINVCGKTPLLARKLLQAFVFLSTS